MKKAFTLAEVLITLGIIGVVAALVMPGFMLHHRKKMTALHTKRFYSLMSNAIKMSEIDNGPIDEWELPEARNAAEDLIWMRKYIQPYLKVRYIGTMHWTHYCTALPLFRLPDESVFGCAMNYNPIGPIYCVYVPKPKGIIAGYVIEANGTNGKDVFWFELSNTAPGQTGNRVFQAPTGGFSGCTDVKGLAQGEGKGCVRLLMENNWDFPANYPIKF